MEAATNQEAWLSEGADKSITVEQLDKLTSEFARLREEYDVAKEAATAKYKVMEDAQRALITALEGAGKRKYQVDGLGQVFFSDKLVYPTPKTVEQKEKLFAFIRSEFGEDFLKEKLSIHHQTLQSICNDAFDRAKEEGKADFQVPGLEAPTNMRSLNFRKERSK